MKKIIGCLLMTLLVFSSIFSMTTLVSASEEKTDNDQKLIYFKVPTEGYVAWGKSQVVYCHIWEVGGGEFYGWQTKSEKCTQFKDGVWSYDLNKLKDSKRLEGGIKKGRTYAVIFSDNIGNQTYDLYFDFGCAGDIVVCNGERQSNPVSPGKYCAIAEWKDNSEFDSVVYDKTPPSDKKSTSASTASEVQENLSKEMGFAVVAIVASVVLLLGIAFVISSVVKKHKHKNEDE